MGGGVEEGKQKGLLPREEKGTNKERELTLDWLSSAVEWIVDSVGSDLVETLSPRHRIYCCCRYC